MAPQIRLAQIDDASQLQAIYAPYCDTPISFEAEPPTIDEFRGRIEKIIEQYPWLVLQSSGEILGYAYAARHRERAAYRWSVDATVYVKPGQHRRGVGRALYASLFAILPLQGYLNAYAGVTLPNPASVGLHLAMGFQPVGVYRQVGFKMGRWHDVAWYHLPLRAMPDEPAESKPLEEVRRTKEWELGLVSGQVHCHSEVFG